VTFTVSQEPVVAFVDAFKAPIASDAVLLAGATNVRPLVGVYGHVSEAARVTYPYVVLGQRTVNGDAGAMQRAGALITLQLDGWSDAKGPFEIQAIGSRIYALMERRAMFRVPGFEVIDGSLHREFAEYYDEPDDDKPGSKLCRMVQRWAVEIHESN
jgi:hypothetical protein